MNLHDMSYMYSLYEQTPTYSDVNKQVFLLLSYTHNVVFGVIQQIENSLFFREYQSNILRMFCRNGIPYMNSDIYLWIFVDELYNIYN